MHPIYIFLKEKYPRKGLIVIYPRKGLIVILYFIEEEGDPSKISIIVLSYTITSIDSKSYLGVIDSYNIPFSRVIKEIKELNTTEKEKVLKINTIGDLSLFTFLAKDLFKPREGPIENKVNPLE
ncbi:uncharacterized protein LY79DRAFT_581233 [Colletotrichum navitas]|uniref:Uncharacterized protein n=1 Tax=Colletotrichum navitas TaxID=681940 RepID=A0AAD8PV56_9PEZI|nr:uncharacterized protein LY79DRAFT_581233 [Colletotrichum navitas]KAK1585287.1 hypothetical protein LY79DRAFT_581233 [Colletotrichum navitas]